MDKHSCFSRAARDYWRLHLIPVGESPLQALRYERKYRLSDPDADIEDLMYRLESDEM